MKFLNNSGSGKGGRLEVLENHIPAVFKIEKVNRNKDSGSTSFSVLNWNLA